VNRSGKLKKKKRPGPTRVVEPFKKKTKKKTKQKKKKTKKQKWIY
jgi:hypothetical protein